MGEFFKIIPTYKKILLGVIVIFFVVMSIIKFSFPNYNSMSTIKEEGTKSQMSEKR